MTLFYIVLTFMEKKGLLVQNIFSMPKKYVTFHLLINAII